MRSAGSPDASRNDSGRSEFCGRLPIAGLASVLSTEAPQLLTPTCPRRNGATKQSNGPDCDNRRADEACD